MGKPSAPTPPDPQETSAASTGTNVSTAIANTMMGLVDQYGPDGSSLRYNSTGYYDFTDPYTGMTYQVPTFEAITRLGDTSQAIFDQNQQTQLGMAGLANDRIGFLRDYLGNQGGIDTAAISNYLYDLGATRLDPRLERDRAALETRLANQGIVPGSEAWNAQMSVQNQTANDAYNSLLLSGNAQAFQQLMAMRNQPINEITALLSGSQIAMPNYQMQYPAGIPTTDNAALINEHYNQQMANYQAEMAQYNNIMGGLFGLAGSAIMASDERVKRDIERVGEIDGLNIYRFNYVWDAETEQPRFGYMAQEVAEIHPEAVVDMGGYLGLDYAKLPEVPVW